MKLDYRRLVVYVLIGWTLLLFYMALLLTHSSAPYHSPAVAIRTSKLSRAARMNLLHGTVERQLIDGRPPVNETLAGWRLWQKDPPKSPCTKYITRFSVNMPRVWLASFPCSGNTWTRYLLEAASGIFTGSIYTDGTIYRKGFLGERDNVTSMRTLVQKTHGFSLLDVSPLSLSKWYQKINTDVSIPTVLLLRNPANAIISYFKLRTSHKHTGEVTENTFKTKKFHKHVEESVEQWRLLALNRLRRTEAPLHVLHYERLVQDPFKELTNLLAFLGVHKDEGRMACIATHLEGKFRRKNKTVVHPYTDEEKLSMAMAAKTVNRTLQLLGYAPLPPYN